MEPTNETAVAVTAPIAPTNPIERAKAKHWIELQLLASGGEISEEMEKFYSQISTDMVADTDKYYELLEDAEHKIELINDRMKKIGLVKKTIENHYARLKNTMKMCMEIQKITRLIGREYYFVLSNTKAALEIDGPVSEEFLIKTVHISKNKLESKIRNILTSILPNELNEVYIESIAKDIVESLEPEYVISDPDKAEIRKFIEAGGELPFARLVQGKAFSAKIGSVK